MNSTESANNVSLSIYGDPALYRNEVMEIYLWPLTFVLAYAVLGCLGNLLVLFIYFFKWPHTKTRFFILVLAVVDFINCSINMPIEAVVLWNPMQFDHHNLCKATRGLTFIANDVSACILVAIAIDRVLCVYKPLKRRVLTMKYARRSCIVALIIGVAVGWPGFVFYGTATLPERLDSVTVLGKTCYISDDFLKMKTHWPFLFSIILFILMIIIFLILIVLYIMIGRKLYLVSNGEMGTYSVKKNRLLANSLTKIAMSPIQNGSEKDCDKNSVSFRDSEEGSQKTVTPSFRRLSRRVSGTNLTASRDNTVTMAMVTVAFMVSFLPYLIIVTLRYIDNHFYFDLSKSKKIAYHVFLRQYFLNSVINPLIYSFSNKKFRLTVMKTFKQLVGRCSRS